jgi:hypothetical protein
MPPVQVIQMDRRCFALRRTQNRSCLCAPSSASTHLTAGAQACHPKIRGRRIVPRCRTKRSSPSPGDPADTPSESEEPGPPLPSTGPDRGTEPLFRGWHRPPFPPCGGVGVRRVYARPHVMSATAQAGTARPGPGAGHARRAVPGSFRAGGSDALVRLRDGTWLNMPVLGWRKDTADRWCVQLRWHMVGVTTMEDWFVYDPGRIRPADGLMPPSRPSLHRPPGRAR